MLKISQQQALQRFDAMPQNLKEALFSEQNADILWKICESQHLSEDKISKIATIAGDAILGFLHPEDLAQEIRTSIGINPEIAASISREIGRKIFTPIKSDLEKAYSPPTKEPTVAKNPADENEIIDLSRKKESSILRTSDVQKIDDINLGTSDVPKIEKSAETKPLKIEEKPEETEKIMPAATTEKEEEKKKEKEIPKPKIEKVESPQKSVLMPKIIHEEKKIAPLTDVKRRSLSGFFSFLNKKTDEKKKDGRRSGESPIRVKIESPADILLETPKATAAAETPKIAKTEIIKPRIVHYNDLKTPSPFGENAKPREIEREAARKTEAKKTEMELPKIEKKAQPPKMESMEVKLPKIEEGPKPPVNLPTAGAKKESKEDVIDLRTFEKIKKEA